jgi:hypothetical protein
MQMSLKDHILLKLIRDQESRAYIGVTDLQTQGVGGGGLLTYVKADIPFRQIPACHEEEVADGLEALAVEIQRGARSKFVVTNLYMPPIRERGHGCFNPGAIRVPATQFLLEGDFNAHSPLWDDSQEPSWRSG